MKLELDQKQLDEVVKEKIKGLEKEVKSLERKLATRDKKINEMQKIQDITKERRDKISDAASTLVEELEDGNWVEIERVWY